MKKTETLFKNLSVKQMDLLITFCKRLKPIPVKHKFIKTLEFQPVKISPYR